MKPQEDFSAYFLLQIIQQGGFAFEYSIEWQNAIGDSPYPFTKSGSANYGVGYFQPEHCDDITTPCEYTPEPCFENLQYAYKHSKIFTNASLENFTVPKDRQGRTQCPEQFTPLRSFRWEADRVKDQKCPSQGPASDFVCPSNLDELRYQPGIDKRHRDYHWVMLSLFLFFLAVTAAYYVLMSAVNVMRRRSEQCLRVQPTWMTVVVPKIGRRPSDSDESAGLLSMKGWNYVDELSLRSDSPNGAAGTPYQSYGSGSDLSSESK